MKKLGLILGAAAMISLVSCGGGSEKSKEQIEAEADSIANALMNELDAAVEEMAVEMDSAAAVVDSTAEVVDTVIAE